MTRNPLRLESTSRFRAGFLLIAVGGGTSFDCSIYDESMLRPDSGGLVGSGDAKGGALSNTGGGPNTGGSAAGGAAADAAIDGSAGMASDGAAGASTGGSGGDASTSTDAGGSGGTGDGGSVRCGFTNCTPCPSPYIACCDRTTGNSCLCAPPDYVSTLCR